MRRIPALVLTLVAIIAAVFVDRSRPDDDAVATPFASERETWMPAVSQGPGAVNWYCPGVPADEDPLALAGDARALRSVLDRLQMTPATLRAVVAYVESRSPGAGRAIVTPARTLTAALGAAARTLAKGSRAE